jgi:dimethylargininase
LRIAITRPVPESIARCELTHLRRQPIDPRRASAQHDEYERVLEERGCVVRRLPAAPDHPDSTFVEDIAVVVDECAVVTRPGATSRRGETASVALALEEYRTLVRLTEPATLDGGDVLVLGRRVYVGASSRTNAEGTRQLAAALEPHGYRVETVVARDCLHLKSAVTSLGDGRLLLDPRSVDAAHFHGAPALEVHAEERFAANVLAVEGTVIAPAGAPRTRERLERAGYVVRPLDVSELAKAEAGLTCCSLIFDH